MSETISLTPEAIDSMYKLRQGSILFIISLLLIITGSIMPAALFLEALRSFIQQVFYIKSYRSYYETPEVGVTEAAVRGGIGFMIISFLLIIGGIALFLASVFGILVSGCDGLAKWDPSYRTGARIFHGIRTGFLMLIVGGVFFVISIIAPLAVCILLIIMGVLAIVAMMNKDVMGQISSTLGIPDVFIIYLSIAFLLFGIMGVASVKTPAAALMGSLIILVVGFILISIAFFGLAIVFLQLGRTFKSMAMMLAGVLTPIYLLSVAALIIVYMEIPEIISRHTSPPQAPPRTPTYPSI